MAEDSAEMSAARSPDFDRAKQETQQRMSIDTQLDAFLQHYCGIPEGGVHIFEKWRLFNYKRFGWAVRAIKENSEVPRTTINIRKFKRQIAAEDVQKMYRKDNKKSTHTETEEDETGRVFSGIVPYDPNEDVIIADKTFRNEAMVIGMNLAIDHLNMMPLVKKDPSGPFLIDMTNAILREEPRVGKIA